MDFPWKARWLKDGHKTPDPSMSNYAGFVSRYRIRIYLAYDDLNDVDFTAAVKHFLICGPEFWLEHVGNVALIRRRLYGGKMAGHNLRIHIRSSMNFLGFKSSQGDTEVWMQESVKSDGIQYRNSMSYFMPTIVWSFLIIGRKFSGMR